MAVYRSIIECYINYCILIFGNASATHLRPLVTAQKKAVRIIASQPPQSHSDPIFFSFNLFKVSDFYKYNLGLYMWKNIDNFEQNFRINLHNTRSGDHYDPTFQRLALAQYQSIMFQAPLNWQPIPDDIKNSISLHSFKRKYKSYILCSRRYGDS